MINDASNAGVETVVKIYLNMNTLCFSSPKGGAFEGCRGQFLAASTLLLLNSYTLRPHLQN